MANIRELGNKVSSLRNMQKVMQAMNMIASTKLQRILGRRTSLLRFEQDALEMARDVALTFRDGNHPLIQPTPERKRACILMSTSDKGLCGSHNNSVQRATATLVAKLEGEDMETDTVCVGLRGASFCHRNQLVVHSSFESSERALTDSTLHSISDMLIERVLADEIQEVYFVFNAFVSTLQKNTKTLQVLPLCSLLPEELPPTPPTFAFEPDSDTFPRVAVSTTLFFLLQATLRHSHLSEHASRMTAMDNATTNSEDLINRYVAIRNRARQTTITNELTEIVAGKEALRD